MRIVLIVLELACVAAVVAGVAMWSVPAALIAGGIAGVVMVERQLAGPRDPDAQREPFFADTRLPVDPPRRNPPAEAAL